MPKRFFTTTVTSILLGFLCFERPTLATTPDKSAFSFHIQSEPHSFDPAQWTSETSYLFQNLFRGLFSYHKSQGLVPEGARECHWQNSKTLLCDLNPKMFWSDGKTVQAEDYVRGFRHLLKAKSKSQAFELLRLIKNAPAIFRGESEVENLGVTAVTSLRLRFDFSDEDPDFILKLTSLWLVPILSENFPTSGQPLISNGPYQIDSWENGKKLHLKANKFYFRGNNQRPNVDVYFIEDDATALNLYEAGRLRFLRRLPTALFAKYKDHPDFVQIPVARFDYVGFGAELNALPELRKALSLSLDYDGLQKILGALGTPGCPSLPPAYMDHPHCLQMDLKAAKAAFQKIPKDILARRWTFGFSKMGGEDIQKAAEWMQAQWKKNLGFQVDLQGAEQGIYLNQLRMAPPSIFRKGLALDRPNCAAGLEVFSKNSAENLIHFDNPDYEVILKHLKQASKVSEKQKLCGKGIDLLLKGNQIIPLGEIHFTMLAAPEFKGWRINEMNQLDLSELRSANP
jgi:oligopeptide transport system substrate-binding protein